MYGTEEPNEFIVIVKGALVRYTNRYGSSLDFPAALGRATGRRPLRCRLGLDLRSRGVFFDDNRRVLDWYFDCIYEEADFYAITKPTTETFTANSIERDVSNREFDDYEVTEYKSRCER
ncbi:hypothetical protein Mycsm_01863 [Mycobacterium sp. JS623]|nr:hypothetical protein Mycsm_01863 [Mycobacterium sp. JS623]